MDASPFLTDLEPLRNHWERPDPDIAGDAVAAVRSRLPFSHDQVKVLVKSGWVTLEGTLEWQYQRLGAEDNVGSVGSWKERTEAENAAWAAPGVRRVDDRLTIRI